MPTKKIAQPKRQLAKGDVKRFAQEYVSQRALVEQMQKRVDEMKAALVQAVADYGYTDDKGNQWLDVGVDGCGKLKRERRVSHSFDPDKAERWLKKQGRFDEFSETIVQVSEEKVVAAAYNGTLPERVVNGFYVDSETMAFKVEK